VDRTGDGLRTHQYQARRAQPRPTQAAVRAGWCPRSLLVRPHFMVYISDGSRQWRYNGYRRRRDHRGMCLAASTSDKGGTYE